MHIILAQPRGFCAGVDRAVSIVKRVLEKHGAPVYVRHEVVHNRLVIEQLKNQGAIFVESLTDVPRGSTVIFSAHGVSQTVRNEAKARELSVFDATCPLVSKVHVSVRQLRDEGYDVVVIGHQGHPEVEGTLGQYPNGMYLVETTEQVETLDVKTPEKLAFVTQTTLSLDDTQQIVDALRLRFPNIVGPRKHDICYATQNRQAAVKQLAHQIDLLIVVGSQNSSNSNRLCEVARSQGTRTYQVDNAQELRADWFFASDMTVGVTAGASAPEVLVEDVIMALKQFGVGRVCTMPGKRESVVFPLPEGVR